MTDGLDSICSGESTKNTPWGTLRPVVLVGEELSFARARWIRFATSDLV